MKKILIPIDGSDYSKRAMEKGKELARAFGSSVVLLNVVYIPLPLYTYEGERGRNMMQLAENAQKVSEEMLKDAKDYFSDLGADRVETVAAEGDISGTIIEYVKSNGVDFIVMGSHGIGAIMHRLLVGSVTTKVLHHVDIPVLVVK